MLVQAVEYAKGDADVLRLQWRKMNVVVQMSIRDQRYEYQTQFSQQRSTGTYPHENVGEVSELMHLGEPAFPYPNPPNTSPRPFAQRSLTPFQLGTQYRLALDKAGKPYRMPHPEKSIQLKQNSRGMEVPCIHTIALCLAYWLALCERYCVRLYRCRGTYRQWGSWANGFPVLA